MIIKTSTHKGKDITSRNSGKYVTFYFSKFTFINVFADNENVLINTVIHIYVKTYSYTTE